MRVGGELQVVGGELDGGPEYWCGDGGAVGPPDPSPPLEGLQLQLRQLEADLVLIQAPLGLAPAAAQLPQAAGGRHRVGHARRQQRQGEGTLTEP